MPPERIRQVNQETFSDFVPLDAAVAVDRRLLEQLLASAPFGIAVLSGPEHRFALANYIFVALAGGRPIAGRSYLEVFPDLAAHLPLIDSVYEQATDKTTAEAQIMTDTGYGPEERWWQFVWTPLYNTAGAIEAIQCCAVETTWRTSEQRTDAEREAFLSVASHELKTPLTVLKGLTQMAQRRLASGRGIEKAKANLAL